MTKEDTYTIKLPNGDLLLVDVAVETKTGLPFLKHAWLKVKEGKGDAGGNRGWQTLEVAESIKSLKELLRR